MSVPLRRASSRWAIIGDARKSSLRGPVDARGQDVNPRRAVLEALPHGRLGPNVQMVKEQCAEELLDVINAGHGDEVREPQRPGGGPVGFGGAEQVGGLGFDADTLL